MTALLAPAYRLTAGHQVVDTTAEPKASATTDLLVTLDMDAWLDCAVLSLGQVGGIAPILDEEAVVELGYAGNGSFSQVFHGYVDVVEAGLLTRRLTMTSTARALARSFVDETYEGQTAGAIVRDLASRAKIGTATIDDGITFPAYVIDSRRPALAHVRDLAALSGTDAYTDGDGKLIFQAFTTGNVIHDIDYAKQILTLDVDRWAGTDAEVTAWGESPTGTAGADAWGWLIKDFSSSAGRAGSGTPAFVLERAALRTADAAATAASAALREFERRAVQGQVAMPGRPEVKLGDAVRLRNVPIGGSNGTYQVRRVAHRVTKDTGFTTTVSFSAIPTERLA
jgi:hypothetical protein